VTTEAKKYSVADELEECRILREKLIDYMAVKHGNQITGLAKELDCSLAVVSRYIRADRPFSGPFLTLVKQQLKGFNTVCDDALKAMAGERWAPKQQG
jgi:hypothetical protein